MPTLAPGVDPLVPFDRRAAVSGATEWGRRLQLARPLAKLCESSLARRLLGADVCVDGGRAWDIRVRDRRVFMRVLALGTLGAGEAYVDGWWDCDDLAELTFRVLRAGVLDRLTNVTNTMHSLSRRIRNAQTIRGAVAVAREHYDLGDHLYFAFLDEHRQYSCGYFRDTEDLDTAQLQKMELICQKLGLKAGMRVLDIGCGWGGLARHMAREYGCEVVGVTNSAAQAQYAKEAAVDLPVTILEQDYRRIRGEFDRIVSVGMFEHVGYKNYPTFMRAAHSRLKDGGLFLLHSMGGNESATSGEPWLEKHIFPNSMLPSIPQIGAAIEGLFVMEDWHNLGLHYAKTLTAWHANFERSWPTLASSFDERFHRRWRYYLLTLAGAFRARRNNLWQIVLSKGGVLEPTDFRRDLSH